MDAQSLITQSEWILIRSDFQIMNKIKQHSRHIITTAVLALFAFDIAASQPKASEHQTATTQFIKANGTTYAYRSFGPKTGTPIVFLQHFMGTMDNWDPAITDGLAKTHHIILFDNTGVGSSSGETPASVSEMAKSAIEFIEALNYTKVDLLGFSIGGCVAQEILLIKPGIVDRAIIAGTGPRGGAYNDISLLIKNHPVTNPATSYFT